MSGDDSGSVISDIAETIGDVAGAAAGELKKFGQSAGAQVSGHAVGSVGTGPSKADISGLSKAAGGAVTDQSAIDEVKDFGKSFLGQITGHIDQLGSADVAKMAKADNKFSQVESAKIKSKINQIYQEYAAKRGREQQQQQLVQQKAEQEKKEAVQFEEKKKQGEMDVAVAQAKAKAEIKNYGAE